MARKLRIGIIGTGGIAHAHMKAYKTFDDVEIVGGADIVPGKARAFLDKWELPDARAYESAEEMIKELEMDGVTVCTYNTQHAGPTVMALNAGLHVQCEKPMSFTLQEGVEMVRAAKKNNRILTIGFQPRYSPLRQHVDRIIQSGAIGKVYYVQSGGGRRTGIPGSTFVQADKAGFGCLGDIGCYSIDECMHAIGYPKPLTVSAVATDYFGKNPKYWRGADTFDVDDFSVAFVRCEGGVTFVFRQAWAMHSDSLGDTLWLGTEGGIKILNGPQYINTPNRVRLFRDLEGSHTDSLIEPIYDFDAYNGAYSKDIFAMKVRDFCDAIRDGRPAPIPGEEILYNQAICDGIYRSSKLGKEVDIVIPEI
ncbi:MAG: Gfo/Idh/MocA family oxidoreductase [Clostridia bacterium]|nr:Gfo/Idh/MocA family oxidoreductase [Clostridia bacterium]MBO4886010.1 Gfo/Idh/MocA family oxidoreductase [Clostridia bacterium]MBR4442685.1 Gfo/Idh/MocA family oxidoreductase [Clostridia bacterium]